MKRVLFSCSAELVISAHTAWSSIGFSGDFTAGTGQIEISAPIEFPFTRNAVQSLPVLGTPGSFVRGIVFDEIVRGGGGD
jgi:hypothetical protein